MKKIAIFGGSFNPPGLHHRHIVEELSASRQFDEVLVIPCGSRPDKPTVNEVASTHRAAMTELAFGNIFGVRVLLFDLKQNSYTPAYRLQEMFGGEAEVWHAVGSDLLVGGVAGRSPIQTTWCRGLEIWQQLNFLVMPRQGYVISEKDLPPHHQLFKHQTGDFSSSLIRDLLSKGASVAHLVAPAVEDYIRQYGLYRGGPNG